MTSRRGFLYSLLGAAAVSPSCSQPTARDESEEGPKMALEDFAPKSMLVAEETRVPRAKFPAIDVHTHLFFSTSVRKMEDPEAEASFPPVEQLDQIVAWMDELNIQTMVNLTGGAGEELRLAIEKLAKPYPGRFLVCTEPSWEKIRDPEYPEWQAEELRRAAEAGAQGIKILKTLGLYLREDLTEGRLIPVDDPRFDPMWKAAGELGLPVFIHTADPDAFFLPTDRFNERWEELGHHPNWSFHGPGFPSKEELLVQRNRVIERHPDTTFVGLHVGNHPEDLDEVSEWLERYPNFYVETGARLGELGRQPRRSRRFFEEHADRILFGTDAIPRPAGDAYPQQTLEPEMFRLYFRFFETEDEYFDYSTAPTPPQGRWQIYGIDLPDEILKKVYHNNAARILGMDLI